MSHLGGFVSRHVGPSVITGIAVVALAGTGIALAANASGPKATAAAGSRPIAAAPSAPPAPAGTHPGKAHGAHKHSGVRGTITAINGATWVVTTAKGASVTVSVTSQTAFGTPKAPSSAANFVVGAAVRVIATPGTPGTPGSPSRPGRLAGPTVVAARILAPHLASA